MKIGRSFRIRTSPMPALHSSIKAQASLILSNFEVTIKESIMMMMVVIRETRT